MLIHWATCARAHNMGLMAWLTLCEWAQFVCTPIQLVSYKTVRIRVTDAAQLEAEQAAADLGNLAGLLG